MASKVLHTSTDSWVNQDAPGINHGPDRRFYLNGDASHTRLGYAYFSQPFPDGALILSATLELTLAAAFGSTTVVTAKRITEKWLESKINYTNRPAITATHSASDSVPSSSPAGHKVQIDVTDMLQDVANGSAWYGVQISIDTSGNKYLWASDAPNDAGPQLTIEWRTVPDAVTDLRPADGAVVSTVTPVVSWTFRDVDGSSDQEKSQVQVSTDPDDFTSPLYDSGLVANTDWAWELGGTLLDDGTVYYWRVRVQDSNGNTSPYSAVQSLSVTPKGTLSVTSPSSTVDETTPPVTWSLSGATQEAYRIILTDNFAVHFGRNGSHIAFIAPAVVWDTGRVLSTATTVHVPAGLIQGDDPNGYTLELRVWDDSDRVATPAEPAFVSDTVTFEWVPGGPSAVGSLTAVDDEVAVELTWTRSTEPDYFALRVDGDIPPGVDVNGQTWDRLLPADYLVSGTTYRLDWYGADPGIEHTYEVMAVVNNAGKFQHSTGNPTATHTTNPLGMWLVDLTAGTRVQIMDTADPSGQWSIGEESTTYYPIGRRDPVRITTSIRGYEGSIGGRLELGTDGVTSAETFRNRLEAMRGAGSSHDLRLIVHGYNLPVQLSGVTIAPIPPIGGYSVGGTFEQVDEWPMAVTDGQV